ncbi:MAG: response regulator transcription factor [Planctomycetaceae bacterium]
MSKVLVVEDQPNLLRSVAQALSEAGFETLAAGTLAEAAVAMRSGIDLMILDVMLPDGSGLDWLRSLRAEGLATLVLMLTARDSVDDRIAGLETGADDYMIKPFALNELLARVRALLRRDLRQPATILTVEDMTLDLLARTVRRGTVQLDLPQRQFELLAYLMKHPGETVSRQMIAEHVWKESSATWTNVIEVQVNQLRKKLHIDGLPPVLHTVRGRGYRIGGDV